MYVYCILLLQVICIILYIKYVHQDVYSVQVDIGIILIRVLLEVLLVTLTNWYLTGSIIVL